MKLPQVLLARPFAVTVSSVLLAGWLAGCSNSNEPGATGVTGATGDPVTTDHVEIPRPDMSEAERAVMLRVKERTAQVEAEPGSAQAWGALGIALEIHDFFDEALVCYERAATLDPDDYRWPFFHGAALRLLDRPGALPFFERALTLRADYAPIACYAGSTARDEGDDERARGAFEAALAIDPDLVAAHLGLAELDLAAQRPEDAVERLEFARALGTRSSRVHALLAQAWLQLGDEEQSSWHASLAPHDGELAVEPVADPVRDGVVLRDGVSLRWRRLRTQRYVQSDDFPMLNSEWQTAISTDPKSAAVRLEAGHALSQIGRPGLAIPYYEEAIALDETSAEAWLGKGNALYTMRKLDEAKTAIEQALELDPAIHQARVNLGAMRIDSGEVDEGIALIRAACAAMPENPDAHYNLAKALESADRTDEAIEAMRVVLGLRPDHLRANLDLGGMFHASERHEDAVERFRRVIALAPKRIDGYLQISVTRKAQGDMAGSVAALESGLEQAPDSAELTTALAWILASTWDDAVRDGERAVELALELCSESKYKDPNAIQILATAYAETGKFQLAVERMVDVENMLKSSPLTPPVRRFLIQMQKRTRKFRQEQPFRDAR
ncbi:MAG: tetratricopeptide repeat protein [bacterium]|nr:tetratricopeptide repeat protein [bacterium]